MVIYMERVVRGGGLYEKMKEAYRNGFVDNVAVRKVGPEIEGILVRASDGMAPRLREITGLFESMNARDGSWTLVKEKLMVNGTEREMCTAVEKEIGGYKATVTTDLGKGTVEITIPPATTLRKSEEYVRSLLGMVSEAAEARGLYLLGVGVQPFTPPSVDVMMPKERYSHMHRVMGDNLLNMTLTAAAQCHIDVSKGEVSGVINALNGFAPAMIALTANSTIVEGRKSGYLEFRGVAWDNIVAEGKLESDRVGVAPRLSGEDGAFELIARFVPFLTKREGEYVAYNKLRSMAEHLSEGQAEVSLIFGDRAFVVELNHVDLAFLEGTVWHEARAKSAYGTVESRACAFQGSTAEIMAIAAVTKGIAENRVEAEERVSRYTLEELRRGREEALREGFGAHVGKEPVEELARDMLDIARRGLERSGEDPSYLKPLYDNLDAMENPAVRTRRLYDDLVKVSGGDDAKVRAALVESMRFRG